MHYQQMVRLWTNQKQLLLVQPVVIELNSEPLVQCKLMGSDL